MNQTQKPDSINWMLRHPKHATDEIAITLMEPVLSRRKQPVSVLSLPAATWRWETRLAKYFECQSFEFTGLERDVHVYKKAEASAAMERQYNVVYHDIKHLDVQEWGAAEKNRKKRFDIVYLDWMGTWSAEKREQIHQLFSRDQVKSFFMCTIALNRGRLDLDATLPKLAARARRTNLVQPTGFVGTKTANWYMKTYGVAAYVLHAAAEYGTKLAPLMVHLYPSAHRNWEIQFLFKKCRTGSGRCAEYA